MIRAISRVLRAQYPAAFFTRPIFSSTTLSYNILHKHPIHHQPSVYEIARTMAFVNAPLADARTFTRGTPVATRCVTRPNTNTVRMGYGDYSILTDKTRGHNWQYYIDKFRVIGDFTKGQPKTDADAVLGYDRKGFKLITNDGIPQTESGELAYDPNSTPDPRLAEASGSVWDWDAAYEKPVEYADVNDPKVVEDAFLAFRDASAAERGAMLTALDLGAVTANQLRSEYGYSESYLLTIEGQHERQGALADRKGEVPFLTPYGKPQTQIPGTDYLGSVSALDFMKKPTNSVSFWKDDQPEESTKLFKKPKGSAKADLPYNTAPAIASIKEDQAAAGMLAAGE